MRTECRPSSSSGQAPKPTVGQPCSSHPALHKQICPRLPDLFVRLFFCSGKKSRAPPTPPWPTEPPKTLKKKFPPPLLERRMGGRIRLRSLELRPTRRRLGCEGRSLKKWLISATISRLCLFSLRPSISLCRRPFWWCVRWRCWRVWI